MRVLKPEAPDPNAPHVKHKDAVLAAINAAAKSPTFDEIRAVVQLTPDALPDGAIHQIALDAGFKVAA